ncbi:DNA methyltransferase [Opitutaceae bacterium TAV5]|nr:DNA methyltransferase [Opitutaceae bacterium TAV5]
MRELALFAGAGGGILGGQLLGWRCVCAVERDAFAAAVLAQRQNDGCLEPFPVWSDVCSFDGRPWRGLVDVVSGGFPCQDISAAGKGVGIDGARSGLWREMARIIREVGPRYVLVENSPMLTLRGLGRVLGDLAALGYDARWGVLGASDAGAPHRRERIWILAGADVQRLEVGGGDYAVEKTGRGGGDHGGGGRSDGGGDYHASAHGRMAHTDDERLARREPGQEDGARPGNVADAARIQSGRAEQRPERERTGSGREPGGAGVPDADGVSVEGLFAHKPDAQERPVAGERPAGSSRDGGEWWQSEPDVAARVDRLKCLGNGQVPAVVALAWRTLRQGWTAGRVTGRT